MKKNRKKRKMMSETASRTMHVAAAVLMLFLMVILNLLASSSCEQMMKTIGENERQLSRLDKECERETARWEALKDDANLDRVLSRLGMSMKFAKPSQRVYMDNVGRPRPGQLSVVMDSRRRGEKPVVKAGKMSARRK